MSGFDSSAPGSSGHHGASSPHGIMARFAEPQQLAQAAQAARAAGFTKWNCYSPYPIPGCWEAMEHKTPMSKLTFLGGLIGGASAFSFITWTQVWDYPWNIGGRPLFSWPSWVPPTFEATILCAGLTAAIGMILVNGLPRPHHPVFNGPQFERASVDRYFLVIEADDPRYDAAAAFLSGLDPEEVSEVED